MAKPTPNQPVKMTESEKRMAKLTKVSGGFS